jgi:putative phosphoesterase
MKIGVVSDTHNNLRNVRRIVELFNDAGVERVVHTGDITQSKTIDVLSALNAPLFGVFGNNDQGELSSLETVVKHHGFHFVQPPLALAWAGRRIVVVHDPEELLLVDETAFDVVLHGHTHRQTIEYTDERLTFNPGESAGMMEGSNSIGILDLAVLSAEVIRF